MGTPLPPNETRETCPFCWGTGERFGGQMTPRFITARLTDFRLGVYWRPHFDSILLTPVDLRPSAQPCQWEIISARIQWFLHYTADFTVFGVFDIDSGLPCFYAPNAHPCATHIGAGQPGGWNSIAWGGIVSLTWDPEYF